MTALWKDAVKMIFNMKVICRVLLVFIFLSGCQAAQQNVQDETELRVVPFVDLNRYLGTWYEIARYPHSFQENCHASQANYSLRPDGNIRVLNQCRLGAFDGKLNEAEGKAWVVDKASNAKLKVQFFWPFSGHYWVIALDPEYQYAVVGHPSRDYLWILSRTPKMDTQLYEKLLQKIEQQGYDTTRLILTPQASSYKRT